MLVNATYVQEFSTSAYASTEVEVPDGLTEEEIEIYLLNNPPEDLRRLDFEPAEYKLHRFDTSDPELYDFEILEEEEDDEEDDE